MDEEHKQLIRENYRALGEQFSTAMDPICAHLYQMKILNDPMRQDILAQKTSRDQAYQLLDVVVKRGPNAFKALYQASFNEMLYQACDLLMSDDAPHEPKDDITSPDELEADTNTEDEALPLDDPWSSSSYIQNIMRDTLLCKTSEDKTFFEKHIGNTNFYQMASRERGQLLVLQEGQILKSMDRKVLDCLCTNLNFGNLKVHCIKDETNLKILEFTPSSDCIVLFIIATDENGFFNGKGGHEKVIAKLKNEKNLVNKPKLIFRMNLKSDTSGATSEGKENEEKNGTVLVPDDNTSTILYPDAGDGTNTQRIKKIGEFENEHEEDLSLGDEVDSPNLQDKSPKDSDIIIVQVTEYGCQILEVEENEITRFFHLIVDVFFKYACQLDFYKLLSKVNLRSQHPVAKCKITGRKKLFFFPGMVSK